MTLIKQTLKKIMLGSCLILCLAMIATPVFAAAPHEDPDAAPLIFSGTSLFQFYSGTLDFVIARDPQSIAYNLQKSPFANIPPELQASFNSYLGSANDLCQNVQSLDSGIVDVKNLLHQSRYNEAAPLINTALNNIASGETELNTITQAANLAAIQFNVSSPATAASIKEAYNVVLARIQTLRDLLDMFKRLLVEQLGSGATAQQIVDQGSDTNSTPVIVSGPQLSQILNQVKLKLTEMTLSFQPAEAFVGDYIKVQGTLSSEGLPMGNRQVYILLNGSQYLAATTDAQGHFVLPLQVPYWYIPTIQVQGLYFPQGADTGVYESSLSAVSPLKVLFYTATLTVNTEANAYPGKNTTVTGQFDYGTNPVPASRDIEIALDNTRVDNAAVAGDFTRVLAVPANLNAGQHLITVDVMASGRYAPILANASLNVIKAATTLTFTAPSVAFIPGRFTVNGKLTAATGPVANAKITFGFAGKQFTSVSREDGTFSVTVNNGFGFGLFGAQPLNISAVPVEPWQSSTAASRNILSIYAVNCGIFFLLILVLAIIVPRRMKFRLGLKRKSNKLSTPETPAAQPVLTAAAAIIPLEAEQPLEAESSEIRALPDKLLGLYRVVIRLVQRISGMLLKPNQTLREFSRETEKSTGAASKPIQEFTRMIERVLYSPHRVTNDEVKNGEQLVKKVREGLKK